MRKIRPRDNATSRLSACKDWAGVPGVSLEDSLHRPATDGQAFGLKAEQEEMQEAEQAEAEAEEEAEEEEEEQAQIQEQRGRPVAMLASCRGVSHEASAEDGMGDWRADKRQQTGSTWRGPVWRGFVKRVESANMHHDCLRRAGLVVGVEDEREVDVIRFRAFLLSARCRIARTSRAAAHGARSSSRTTCSLRARPHSPGRSPCQHH
jgi:hypothetical protein